MFAVALVVIGLAALWFTTGTNSMMQLATAPSIRGRIMAIRLAIVDGGTLLGAPIVGWIADQYGPAGRSVSARHLALPRRLWLHLSPGSREAAPR
jgi:MFS family permease